MILFRVANLSIAMLIFCGASAQTSPTQGYPAIIKDSLDRRARAEREWRRMLATYNVPQTPPDFYPIIYTPKSLLGVTGGIKLSAEPFPQALDSLAVRETMRAFIDRWREMIGADPGSLSLIAVDRTDSSQRFTYQQANYPLPLAAPDGQMSAVVSDDGKLLQLDDRVIPVVELPAKPAIDKETAAKRLVGRVFTFTDIGGREQRKVIAAEGEVNVKRLVVLPVAKADAIEVHIAWEITAGNSPSWTVYTDAMTGEELRLVQNFQT